MKNLVIFFFFLLIALTACTNVEETHIFLSREQELKIVGVCKEFYDRSGIEPGQVLTIDKVIIFLAELSKDTINLDDSEIIKLVSNNLPEMKSELENNFPEDDKTRLQYTAVLLQILPDVIGTERTIEFLAPMLDVDAAEFYFTEINKAEKELELALAELNKGNKNVYCFVSSCNKYYWSYMKANNVYQSMCVINSDFMPVGCVQIGFDPIPNGPRNHFVHYSCGPFGCEKSEQVTDDGYGYYWKYTKITFEEFQRHYVSNLN